MKEIYCGVGDVPKGHKAGTMKECAEKGQIRMYGLHKIDPKTLDLVRKKQKMTESREKLLIKLAGYRGLINRFKGRYEGAKDKDKKKEYYTEWKKAEANAKKIIEKAKKIEEMREKAISSASKKSTKSTKSTTKKNSKTKAKTTEKNTKKKESKKASSKSKKTKKTKK